MSVESIERRGDGVLATLATLPQDNDAEILARYGKHPNRVPAALLAAGEAVKVVARKLTDEMQANVVAAEEMLEMLKREQEQFAADVTRAADGFARRVNEFMVRGVSCMQSISAHREAIIEIAKIPDAPSAIEPSP